MVRWVGEINNKDHLSPAEAGRWAELGNQARALNSCLWLCGCWIHKNLAPIESNIIFGTSIEYR